MFVRFFIYFSIVGVKYMYMFLDYNLNIYVYLCK